jgi:hypothetical protein
MELANKERLADTFDIPAAIDKSAVRDAPLHLRGIDELYDQHFQHGAGFFAAREPPTPLVVADMPKSTRTSGHQQNCEFQAEAAIEAFRY